MPNGFSHDSAYPKAGNNAFFVQYFPHHSQYKTKTTDRSPHAPNSYQPHFPLIMKRSRAFHPKHPSLLRTGIDFEKYC
jgi:hypothetical protein